jgi:hypothetical protein
MSIILHTDDGRDMKINAWNWGVLHHIVAGAGLFSDDIWEPKRYNGGGILDSQQVTALANFLESKLLPRFHPGERIFADGTVTDVPDDGRLYRGEEGWKNYSLRHDVLVAVIEFLRSAHGDLAFY